MRSESRPSAHGVSRRKALKFLGTATALPLFDPTPLSRAWEPRFLSRDELSTVATLAECIVPPTERPGAREVAVHEYIDLALCNADASVQRDFKEGLDWLEAHVARSRRRKFNELDREQQLEWLAEISDTSRAHEPKGYAFFTQIKQLAIEGYYRPEIGSTV